MSVPGEKTALFIDGANLYATAKSLGFDIDYKKLLREFQSRGNLLRAFYYTAVIEDQEYSSIRPLIDWLDYNGYTVVTKATKEFVDQTGRRKVKGNMDIELAVDAMELAPHIDHMVLFSGDGDFRSLVESVQRRGVRVTVISTITTQPPMVADELRRQADIFLDIVELQPKIGRDPSERPPREPAGASAYPAVPATRRPAARRRRCGRRFRGLIGRFAAATISRHAWQDRQTRPRLPALPEACGVPPSLAAARAVLVQRPGPLVRPARGAAPDRRLGAGLARRQPHRAAVYRRLRRRVALRYAQGIRLRPRRVPGARRRHARIGRRPHHQRGALRAAGKQAGAGRNQHLPRFPGADHYGNAQPARHRGARPDRPRDHREGARRKALGRRVQPRRHRANRHADVVFELSLLALQHQHRRAHAGNVPRRVRGGPPAS